MCPPSTGPVANKNSGETTHIHVTHIHVGFRALCVPPKWWYTLTLMLAQLSVPIKVCRAFQGGAYQPPFDSTWTCYSLRSYTQPLVQVWLWNRPGTSAPMRAVMHIHVLDYTVHTCAHCLMVVFPLHPRDEPQQMHEKTALVSASALYVV